MLRKSPLDESLLAGHHHFTFDSSTQDLRYAPDFRVFTHVTEQPI